MKYILLSTKVVLEYRYTHSFKYFLVALTYHRFE